MNRDLFPETLLVDIADGHTFTTSLKVAEHFGKRHDNVMRSIEKLNCSPEFRRLNFEAATYLDAQKKPREMYRLSHDGFGYLCMRFTGAEAGLWQEKFLAAFRAMEAQLRAKTESVAAAYHRKHPTLAAVVSCTERGLSRHEAGAIVTAPSAASPAPAASPVIWACCPPPTRSRHARTTPRSIRIQARSTPCWRAVRAASTLDASGQLIEVRVIHDRLPFGSWPQFNP